MNGIESIRLYTGIKGKKLWEEFWKESFEDFIGEKNGFKVFPIEWDEPPIKDKDYLQVSHGIMSKFNMRKINWRKSKGGRSMEHIKQGYVDGELAFQVEGGLCLTDLREMKASIDKFVSPKHYRLHAETNRLEEAKLIAHELLNNINLEKHEANYQEWVEAGKKSAKLIAETEAFLETLRDK